MSIQKISVQKYAMLFGTIMGIFWIAKFVFFPLGMTYSFFGFAFLVLTLAVPFLGYRYICMFRDKTLKGYITFGQAWSFSVFMYIFAALLVGVAHYIYFEFIDQGFILSTYISNLENLNLNEMEGMEGSLESLQQNLELIGNLTAIELTLQLFYLNIIAGGFISIPTALLAIRKNKNNSSTFLRQ